LTDVAHPGDEDIKTGSCEPVFYALNFSPVIVSESSGAPF